MDTVPTYKSDKLANLIGCNLKPGMTRGGMAVKHGLGRSARSVPKLGDAHLQIKQAADDVLLGRQMPRAEESQP